MAQNIAKPNNPSRKEILDTIGDQGMDKWRNPMHLVAIKGGWPKSPQTESERVDRDIFGMEMRPSHRNGCIPK